MISVGRLLVLPRERNEFGEGRSEKPTGSQREPRPLHQGYPSAVKTDIQYANAVRVFGFSEGFELEVPLARI